MSSPILDYYLNDLSLIKGVRLNQVGRAVDNTLWSAPDLQY